MLLTQNGLELVDVAWMLSSTLPNIISVAFNPSASRNILNATVSDIVDAIKNAQPHTMEPKVRPRE